MLKKLFILIIIIINFILENPLSVEAITLNQRINEYPQWHHKISLPQTDQDLMFPSWLEGKWKASSILKAQIAPLAPKFKTPGFDQNEEYIDKEINFNVRYISTIQLPKQDNFLPSVINTKKIIIADRAFNGLSIAQAYMGIDNVQKVISNPNNSTEQITQFRSNNQLISTVIGRRQETVSDQEFITSEITRQFFRRPDSVYLNLVENTTKYKFINSILIEGEQISAVYLSPEDPDYFIALDKPVALYYYTLKLEKE